MTRLRPLHAYTVILTLTLTYLHILLSRSTNHYDDPHTLNTTALTTDTTKVAHAPRLRRRNKEGPKATKKERKKRKKRKKERKDERNKGRKKQESKQASKQASNKQEEQ